MTRTERRPAARAAAIVAVVALVAGCGDAGAPGAGPASDQPSGATGQTSPDPVASPPPSTPDASPPGDATPAMAADDPRLAAGAGRQRAVIVVDGRPRAFTAVVPASAIPGPAPVVLAFHGFGQVTDAFLDVAGLPDAAEREGWVLLAPDGVNRSFNAGDCCGPAEEETVDDVALARALVAEAAAVLGWDEGPTTVVATGFSNGGMMSHRLACEAADLVDAVVPASGGLEVSDCMPSRPVEVRHVHGSSDLVVPQSRGAASMDRWAEVLNCTSAVTDDDGDDGLEGTTWSGCDRGVTVSFALRRGAGHDWLVGPPLDTNALVAEVVAAAAAG